MLDANLKSQLQAYLQRVTAPVELIAAPAGDASSAEMLQLLQQIAALSPQIAVRADQDSDVCGYAVDVMDGQRAKALTLGELVAVELESGAVLKSRSIVVATGARRRELGVPGEREYRGRGVAYCPHCDGPLFKGKRVAVVGGGNSGVEAAIDLGGMAAQVTLLEFDGRLRADAVPQRKLASLDNVRVVIGAATTEVVGDGSRVTALAYRDRGSVALTPRGEIEVDARGQTSLPGVFAAGDATTVPYKQIIIAMGEGAKAALGAFDHLIRAPLPQAAARATIAA